MSFLNAMKSGGGFLNNVDGRLLGFEWTAVPPNGQAEGEWVYLVPSIRVDGSDKDVTQHLFFGGADKYAISADGRSITMRDGSPVTFGAKTPVGRFLTTLVQKGGDAIEAVLPNLEEGAALNLDGVAGSRVRFVQEKDEAGTAKRGQREVKDPKTGKVAKYDRTNTVISAVYEVGGGAAKSAAPKTNGTGKAKATAAADNSAEVATLASATLLDVLGNTEDGSIQKAKLRVKLMQALGKNPLRDAVIAYLFDDNNLVALEGVDYDPSNKQQVISLA